MTGVIRELGKYLLSMHVLGPINANESCVHEEKGQPLCL